MSNVLPVVTKQGNTHKTLQNHLDTLLEAAKSHDKTLKLTTKAYHQLLSLLVDGAKGKQELTKTQIDCIKIVLGEHKHLNKLVSDIEELVKKIRVVDEEETATKHHGSAEGLQSGAPSSTPDGIKFDFSAIRAKAAARKAAEGGE